MLPTHHHFPPESPSLCPRCQATVDPHANQCRECGEYFPNAEQRQGDAVGGMMCGTVRGIGIGGVVIAAAGGWHLLTSPLSVGAVVAVVIGLILFSVCMLIASRMESGVYDPE